MSSLIAGLVAIGLVTVAVPAASASGATDTIRGGCIFDTDQNATLTGGANVGVIGDASITTDASGLPTDATVFCKIQVNGADAPHTTYSYSGFAVQDGVDRISFAASMLDSVAECQRVVFADGTDTGWVCPVAAS